MSIKSEGPEVKTGFLQRWSNKKVEAQTENNNELENEGLAENEGLIINSSDEGLVSQDVKVEEFKTDADMPPVEDLTEDSDYSGFLSPKVSDILRKQALRKLFHLPFLNVVDGLDDYAEDYTKFETLGDIIPHDLKRMLEREKEKELKEKEEQEFQAEESLKTENIHADETEIDELDDDADFDDDSEELQLASNNAVVSEEIKTTEELINLKDE